MQCNVSLYDTFYGRPCNFCKGLIKLPSILYFFTLSDDCTHFCQVPPAVKLTGFVQDKITLFIPIFHWQVSVTITCSDVQSYSMPHSISSGCMAVHQEAACHLEKTTPQKPELHQSSPSREIFISTFCTENNDLMNAIYSTCHQHYGCLKDLHNKDPHPPSK